RTCCDTWGSHALSSPPRLIPTTTWPWTVPTTNLSERRERNHLPSLITTIAQGRALDLAQARSRLLRHATNKDQPTPHSGHSLRPMRTSKLLCRGEPRGWPRVAAQKPIAICARKCARDQLVSGSFQPRAATREK